MEGTKGGPNFKFQDPRELKEKIDTYFHKCDNRTKEVLSNKGEVVTIDAPAPYTITGLALALGTNRQTLINYEKWSFSNDLPEDIKNELIDAIKEAKAKVENNIESGLLDNEWNSTGSIFNLKNNFGWKDKTEIENTNKNIDVTPERLKNLSDKELADLESITSKLNDTTE